MVTRNDIFHILSLIICFVAFGVCTSAQNDKSTPIIDRLSFKTNALEWLATIPNFSFEYDIWPDSTRVSKGRFSAQVSVKYNWNTYHKYKPSMVFNLFDIRPEVRYYWRPIRKEDYWIDYETRNRRKPTFYEWIRYDAFSHLSDNPKNRAYYAGIYLSYSDYALKVSPIGYQSGAIGIGGSLGYSIPLYEYERGNIDIELGFSLGFLLHTDYQTFAHDPNGYFYYGLTSPRVKFTPYPVVSELRVAFAYRNKSIKDKYKTETRYERQSSIHRYEVISAGGHSLYMETQKEIEKAERKKKNIENKEKLKSKFEFVTKIFKKKDIDDKNDIYEEKE